MQYNNMEEKKEMIDNLLCAACLGLSQSLHNVTDDKLRQYYLDTLNEMPLSNTQTVCPRLCWECCARLKKAVEFKDQVKDCHRILQTYTNDTFYECLFTEITRPPRLKVHVVEPVSITGDKQMGEKETQERLYVKEEIEILWDKRSSDLKDSKHQSTNDSSDDDLPLSECLSNGDVDTLSNDVKQEDIKRGKPTRKAKSVKKLKKKINEKNIKEDMSRQKIITIEMSYEEMMAEREADMTRDNYLKAEYKCESCVNGFNNNKSYKTHMKTKHCESLGDYTCPICKTVLSTLDSLTTHYKRHTKRYECSICKKRTMDVKVMQQHYYSNHEITLKQYTCNICGKQSNSLDTHRYHKDTHKARVQCSDCDKTFSHRAGLMNHTLAVHEYNNAFPCTECDKVFRWKTSLTRHLEKHDVKNKSSSPAYCSTCEVSFSSVSSYQRHMRNSLKHVTQDQLKFICDHCDRRFADKTKLRDHIEEKHLHRTYECHICRKPSKNRVGLDQHIRNVHKGRPNNKMCHHCGKGFPTKVQLESHIRTHTGERPFICEYCPTTFSQQSNLYKHNRQVHLHIKSKRYPLCKKQKDINNIEQTIATVNQTIDTFRSMPVYEREFVM